MNMIYLVPFGETMKELLAELQEPLRQAFHADAAVLDPHPDMSEFYDEQRNQYNSTTIVHYIKERYAGKRSLGQRGNLRPRFLGITSVDLFIPILTYVFGEAELSGNAAVASYYRLRNEIYGLPPNRGLLMTRLQKEAIHELGHAHGLLHCVATDCVMHTSTYVEDIDLKGDEFCAECRKSLDSSIKN